MIKRSTDFSKISKLLVSSALAGQFIASSSSAQTNQLTVGDQAKVAAAVTTERPHRHDYTSMLGQFFKSANTTGKDGIIMYAPPRSNTIFTFQAESQLLHGEKQSIAAMKLAQSHIQLMMQEWMTQAQKDADAKKSLANGKPLSTMDQWSTDLSLGKVAPDEVDDQIRIRAKTAQEQDDMLAAMNSVGSQFQAEIENYQSKRVALSEKTHLEMGLADLYPTAFMGAVTIKAPQKIANLLNNAETGLAAIIGVALPTQGTIVWIARPWLVTQETAGQEPETYTYWEFATQFLTNSQIGANGNALPDFNVIPAVSIGALWGNLPNNLQDFGGVFVGAEYHVPMDELLPAAINNKLMKVRKMGTIVTFDSNNLPDIDHPFILVGAQLRPATGAIDTHLQLNAGLMTTPKNWVADAVKIWNLASLTNIANYIKAAVGSTPPTPAPAPQPVPVPAGPASSPLIGTTGTK